MSYLIYHQLKYLLQTLYYYTNGRPAAEINPALLEHSTLFKARKGHETEVVAEAKRWKQILKQFIPPILVDLIKK